MTKQERSKIIAEIRRHAEQICSHPKDCQYWTGQGCSVSMLHDAEDILQLVEKLEQ